MDRRLLDRRSRTDWIRTGDPLNPIHNSGCFPEFGWGCVLDWKAAKTRSQGSLGLQFLEEVIDEDGASRTAASSALAIFGSVEGNWLATWLQIRLARVREDLVQLELARLHERFFWKRARALR